MIDKYSSKNLDIVTIKENKNGKLDLFSVCKFLSNKKINNLLVEAGSNLFASFFNNNLLIKK